MDHFTRAVCVAGLLLFAIAIAVLNDQTKKRAQRKARVRRKKPRAQWANHHTSWSLVATFVVFVGLLLLTAVVAPGREFSNGVMCLLVLAAGMLVALMRFLFRFVRRG